MLQLDQESADRLQPNQNSERSAVHQLVEHILEVVMNTCEPVTGLNQEQRIGAGTPMDVNDDLAVAEACLDKKMGDDGVRAAFARAARAG